MRFVSLISACVAVSGAVLASPTGELPETRDVDAAAGWRGSSTVDLGYGVYNGVYNSTTGLNVWKGIQFAAPPVGKLRWQPPQAPATNRTPVTASSFGPACPQALPSVPGAVFIPGDEDCLFLNVYAPKDAKNLPVLVWIHGGGYGLGDGTQDMSEIIGDNGKSFIAVAIQYRLGAFGWASSQDVKSNGVVNAGILDQAFALDWVQKYICQFGGDATNVTISGESAGAGSVMYHAMNANGTLGTKRFKNGIAASPYLIGQYNYNAPIPTSRYYNFSQLAGCGSSGNVFPCLVGKDTMTLQMANYNVTQKQTFGMWAFLPVTDGSYISALPSVQLNQKKVNGVNIFVGNNADEGAIFVPPGISTEADLRAWLHQEFPTLNDANITAILNTYPTNYPANGPKFETTGISPPTANDVSELAAGQQQRAYNIYAESTFVCPSYWLATAFTQPGKAAYHYQYSVPFAAHGQDVSAYFGPATPNQGPEFTLAFRKMWGGIITKDNPSIPNQIANGASAANPAAPNPASNFPAWTDANPRQINLNETGGVPYQAVLTGGVTVTQYQNPGLKNAITVANAFTWEGGRGQRCNFWKALDPYIPQ